MGDRSHLCWVGLNPGTADTDSGPRPTSHKVVGWAKREGGSGSAVQVVNLFSYRATDPRALWTATVDIIGSMTDKVTRESSGQAAITLVAWVETSSLASAGHICWGCLSIQCVQDSPNRARPRNSLYVPAATRSSSMALRRLLPVGG